jgi:hypothetical protein
MADPGYSQRRRGIAGQGFGPTWALLTAAHGREYPDRSIWWTAQISIGLVELIAHVANYRHDAAQSGSMSGYCA